MTKLCFMCLGCQRLEDSKFEGVWKCENWVNNYAKKEKTELDRIKK
jgi:hypothetical protein